MQIASNREDLVEHEGHVKQSENSGAVTYKKPFEQHVKQMVE